MIFGGEVKFQVLSAVLCDSLARNVSELVLTQATCTRKLLPKPFVLVCYKQGRWWVPSEPARTTCPHYLPTGFGGGGTRAAGAYPKPWQNRSSVALGKPGLGPSSAGSADAVLADSRALSRAGL